jgi:hypothetical protein
MNSSFSVDEDYFGGLFERRLSKTLFLSFSLFMSIIVIFSAYCIIWIGQNDNRKTMLTRLFTSAWFLTFGWFGFAQVSFLM